MHEAASPEPAMADMFSSLDEPVQAETEAAPPEAVEPPDEVDATAAEPDPSEAEAEADTGATDEPKPEAQADEVIEGVSISESEAHAEPEAEAASEESDQYEDSEIAEEEPEVAVSYDLPQALFDAGIDVDAALGALSFELASSSYDEDHAAASRLPPFSPPDYHPKLRMPSAIRLRRGQIGSVVPALILIGLGAWMTLSNAAGAPLDPMLVGMILVGGLMVSFAAEWLFSGRWARGLLLVALLALFAAGGSALVLQSGADNALVAYPLLLSALGIAIILSGLLARPVERVMLGPGMVFITAGIVGFLVLDGVIPATVLSTAAAYWFVPATIVLLLVLLPLIFRKPS